MSEIVSNPWEIKLLERMRPSWRKKWRKQRLGSRTSPEKKIQYLDRRERVNKRDSVLI